MADGLQVHFGKKCVMTDDDGNVVATWDPDEADREMEALLEEEAGGKAVEWEWNPDDEGKARQGREKKS